MASQEATAKAIAWYLDEHGGDAAAAFSAAERDCKAVPALRFDAEHWGSILVGLARLANGLTRAALTLDHEAMPVRDASKYQCRECGSTEIHIFKGARFDVNSGRYLEPMEDSDDDVMACLDCSSSNIEEAGHGWQCATDCGRYDARPFVRLQHGRPDGGFTYYCADCEGEAVACEAVAPR